MKKRGLFVRGWHAQMVCYQCENNAATDGDVVFGTIRPVLGGCASIYLLLIKYLLRLCVSIEKTQTVEHRRG